MCTVYSPGTVHACGSSEVQMVQTFEILTAAVLSRVNQIIFKFALLRSQWQFTLSIQLKNQN